MFTAEHFKERLNEIPFRPFRIHMSDGKSYDIANHDVALVKRHAVEIGLDPDQNSIAERFVHCAMIHMSRVEDLERSGLTRLPPAPQS
jgi:hypothetical protein